MKHENLKRELLDSPESSSILLAINYKKEAKISDILKLTKLTTSILDSIIKKLEKAQFVKSKKSVFSIDWDVLMPEILSQQRKWIWEFVRLPYKYFPEESITTPSKLDEIIQNMVKNTYILDFYKKFLSIYFELIFDLKIKKSIYELLIEDFFDYLLPRYYHDIQSTMSKIGASKTSDFSYFKEFLDISFKVASTVHRMEGSAFSEAIDLSSPIFFEKLVADELEKQGFKFVKETAVADSGLDILADMNGKKIGIEIKAYDKSVIPSHVIERLGRLRAELDELILVTSANSSNEAIQAAKKFDIRIITIDKIGQIGRLLKIKNQELYLEPHGVEKSVKEFNESFKGILERIKKAITTDEKKKSLEDLAEVIINQIDDLKVIDRNLRSSAEEIDLLIGNESKEMFWVRLGSPILLECKNWKIPVGSKEIRDFAGKIESAGVTTGILIAPNGITGDEYKDARSLIRENRIKGKHIIVIENEDLIEIANGIHPSDKINEGYYDIFKI